SAELERIGRVQSDKQHDERRADAQREQHVEHEARDGHHEQRDDEHDAEREPDFRVAFARAAQGKRCHGSAHATVLPARVLREPRERRTKARTSATAMYSSYGMSVPTFAVLRSARASGLFSTIGTPASAAIALIRSAIFRWPMAKTIGAGAIVGSYLMAIAMCVGLTMTTSAFGTSFIICRRAYERAMARRRCLICGSP